MSYAEILLIALGLAMDAFAVAIAAGASRRAAGPRAAFRLAFHFGLFQFLMPVLGWLAGQVVAGRIAAFDHWIAFGLLATIGARMIRSGLSSGSDGEAPDPSRGLSLLMLSVATSIDALAVGLSLAVIGIRIWMPSAVIGVVAAILTLLGLRLGHRMGLLFGRRMETIGGLILIGIGLKILIEHQA